MTTPVTPITRLQQRAGVVPDGVFGPATYRAARGVFGLNNNQAAHFFGQCAHETGGFRLFSENLNYSTEGLRRVFPKYFATDAIAAQYARQPQRIANRVYGGRMGNGLEASGDGWKFRGRGAIQLTGKSNYQAFANFLKRQDIMTNPDIVALDLAFDSAIFFFRSNSLFQICDRGVTDEIITLVSRRVNGGTHGLQDRIQRTKTFASWN